MTTEKDFLVSRIINLLEDETFHLSDFDKKTILKELFMYYSIRFKHSPPKNKIKTETQSQIIFFIPNQ